MSGSSPVSFMFGNDVWKTKNCGDCYFLCSFPGGQQKANGPEFKECRESPPVMYLMPGMTPLKQPIMQVVHQYPRLEPKYPACSRFRQKQNTQDTTNG